MADIFVSYSHADVDRARSIAAALEAEGWTVWWDPEVRSGESFVSVINREIALAKCVVVLWSNASVTSRWVLEEAHYALNKEVFCPVLIDRGPQLPVGFATIKYVALTAWDGDRPLDSMQALVDQVARRVPRSTPAAASPVELPPAERSPEATQTLDRPRAAPPPYVPPPVADREPPMHLPARPARRGFIDFSDLWIIDYPVVALLAAGTTLLLAETISRYLVTKTFGVSDLFPLMISTAAFLGAAIAIRNGRTVTGPVGVFARNVSGRLIGHVDQVLLASIFGVIAWLMAPRAWDSYKFKELTTGVGQFSLWPWKFLLVAAFAGMALASLYVLFRHVTGRQSR